MLDAGNFLIYITNHLTLEFSTSKLTGGFQKYFCRSYQVTIVEH